MIALIACFVTLTPQMPLSVATTDDALAVFANPAGLGVRRGPDLYCIYNWRSVPVRDIGTNLSLAGSVGPLGAYWSLGSRYGLALGGGPREFRLGARLSRDSLTRWDTGVLSRPTRWLSLGITWQDLGHDFGKWQIGAAVRPLGNRLTLFGEAFLRGPLAGVVGIEAEPMDGASLAVRVLPGASLGKMYVSAGVTFGLGRVGVGVLGTRYPNEVAALLRFGGEQRRSLLPSRHRCVDVKLRGAVEDQKPGFSLSARRTRTTWDLLDLLRRCRDDRAVRAVLLEFDGVSMSLAQAEEVRAGILGLSAAGKKVYAYSDSYGMLSYFIASACDRVYTHVQGGVEIPGLSLAMPFLKGALEKLGLKADFSRHGKYKSAVEIFSEDSLTAPNREQYEALLDAMYRDWVRSVSAGRRLGADSVQRLVDRGWFMPAEAQAAGLVDTFCYRDELDTLLSADLRGLHRVGESEFAGLERHDYDWQVRPAIAIVYASGAISSGESGTDFLSGNPSMGAQTMIRAIAAARKDPRVKAIVLRIDSPGGDGFASDLIWHELELARKKKPVIASMAGVAASGGYYIASNARRVFAEPATLTGSIGVFTLKFVTEGLYNKLGIRRQVVKRGEHADASSDLREYTPEEDSAIQAQADWFYNQFVEKVALGRNLTFAHVDSVGQGRVWAGSDARRVGLVDSLGGLLDAVEYAKKEAGLGECDFVFYPKPRADLLSMLGGFARERILTVLYE